MQITNKHVLFKMVVIVVSCSYCDVHSSTNVIIHRRKIFLMAVAKE